MILPDLIRDAHDFGQLPHGVDAHDVRTAEHSGGDRGSGRPVSRGDVGIAPRQRPRQERLAGRPDNDGTTELGELVETGQDLEAVRRFLRKAKAGSTSMCSLGIPAPAANAMLSRTSSRTSSTTSE
jgi:hypothetical protein